MTALTAPPAPASDQMRDTGEAPADYCGECGHARERHSGDVPGCIECRYCRSFVGNHDAHEVVCPSCSATIRARMADTPVEDPPLRSITAAEDVCRAAGLRRYDHEYGPWLSEDGRIGVGIARLGSMYLGAGVSLVLDRDAEQEQQIAKIEPGAPASLLRSAIDCARALSGEATPDAHA